MNTKFTLTICKLQKRTLKNIAKPFAWIFGIMLFFTSFTISAQLDCNGAKTLQFNQLYSESTQGGSNNVSIYNNDSWWQLTGPELVFILDWPGGDLDIQLTNKMANLDLILLASCDANNYMNSGGGNSGMANSYITRHLVQGKYFVIIDGWQGAEGSFDLEIQTQVQNPPKNFYYFNSGPQTKDEPSDDIVISNNCVIDQNSYDININVSDVPLLDDNFSLRNLFLRMTIPGDFQGAFTLISPMGTEVVIADSDLGSWPSVSSVSNQFLLSIHDCEFTNHDDDFFIINAYHTLPVGYFGDFYNEDPNGIWRLSFCGIGGSSIQIDRMSLYFQSATTYAFGLESTPTTSCNASDGTIEYKIIPGVCNTNGYYTKLDDGMWVYFPYVPLVQGDAGSIPEGMESGLSTGIHYIYTAKANIDGTIDLSTQREFPFFIETDNDNQAPDAICKSTYTVQLDANGFATIDPKALDNGSSDNCSTVLSFSASPNTFDFADINVQNACGINALDFNLSTNGDSYGISQDPIIHGSTFTYEAWVNTVTNGSTFDFQGILTTETVTSGNLGFVQMAISSDGRLIGEIAGDNFFYGLIGQNPISIGWSHIAITYDGQDLKLYVNGIKEPTSFLSGDPNVGNLSIDHFALMGAERLLNPNGFSSLIIDEARIWNVAKTEQDIQANMLSCLTGNELGLIAYWDVEGGSGTTITEKVNGNHMSLINTDDNNWVPGAPVLITNGIISTLTVTDANGNTSTCDVEIIVEDFDLCQVDVEAPTLTGCPQDIVVALDSNGEVIVNFTTPTFFDNCGVTTRTVTESYTGGATSSSGEITHTGNFTDDFMISGTVLGAGLVTITFIGEDASGNMVSCTFTITVTNSDLCDSDTESPVFIDCPGDQTILLDENGNGFFNLTDPDFSDNCTIVSEALNITYMGGTTDDFGNTNYSYSTLLPGSNFTYSIVGLGSVLYDYEVTDQAGNTTHCKSIITSKESVGPCANDITNPVLENCQQNSVLILDNSNQATITIVAPDATDNCGIASRSVEVTYNGGATNINGEVSKNYLNFHNGASGTFTIVGTGDLNVKFSVVDTYGNVNSCNTTISTIHGGTDVKCDISDECIIPGSTLSLPVRVTNFTNIGAFSFDLEVPANSGISFVGLDKETLNNVSYNVLNNGDLRVAWDEPNGVDISLVNNTRIFNIEIVANNSFSASTTITGKDVVILQSGIPVMGHIDFATVCVGSGVTPNGKIYNLLNENQSDIKVNLVGGSNVVDEVITNALGEYSFSVANNTYEIKPYKNDEIRKGITITDVARIRRHFLQKLTLDSDYKKLAADVNKDGKINVIDVAFINRVFLKKLNEFPGNTSWRFVPTYTDISTNPLNVNVENRIELDKAGLDLNNLDFYSIKTGDVDHSALSLLQDENNGNRSSVSLTIPDTVLTQEIVDIPVYLSGSDRLSALSYTLKYDTNIVELVTIKAPSLKGFSGGSYNDTGGEILIGWDHPQGEDVDVQGVLMHISFKSKENGMTDILIKDPSFYDINLNEIDVNTKDGSIDFMTATLNTSKDDYSIIATPNPFTDIVSLEIKTSVPQKLSIQFTDVSGKILKTIHSNELKINHLITVDDLDVEGVIIVVIEGTHFIDIQRLIKL